MERGEVEFLNQLAETLKETEKKLELAYQRKDVENFNKIKRFIFQIQEKISEVVK